MVLLRTYQHIHVRVLLHQKSFAKIMSGWTLFRWIRKRFVQTWPSIILIIFRHSIECTILRYFLQDVTLLGQIELKWVLQPPKIWDKTTLSQITPAQLMRKAATVRNTQVTLRRKTPMELAMGKRPRDLIDLDSMNPEQLTSTTTTQDLLNEEIQKCAMNEDTSRGTTTRRHSTKSCWRNEICSSRFLSRRTSDFLPRRSK